MASEKIVVAVRDASLRQTLIEALNDVEFETIAAANAVSLQGAVKRHTVSMVCLGMDMDDLDYESFIAGMAHSASDYVPVLMVADPDNLDALAKYFDMGATDFIVPPFEHTRLCARITTGLGRRYFDDGEPVDLRQLLELNVNLKQHVLPLGHIFSQEPNLIQLAERVVHEAQVLCNADGGTLYLVTDDDRLQFMVMNTQSLGVAIGGNTGIAIPFLPLNLYDPETGEQNQSNVATATYFREETIHVPDVYDDTQGLDFTATKAFDAENNYRTVSCLTIPMKDSGGKVMGVLELLNATDVRTGEIVPFKQNDVLLAESLAMQAAVAINNHFLMQQRQQLVKFETDVQVGRTVQASFLPHTLPEPKGWDIAARFHPAREVAGDFYDVFEVRRNLVGLVMADVCDKGVPAAIYMALARSVIRAFTRQTYSLSWAGDLFEGGESPGDERKRPDFQATPLKEGLTRANNYLVANHSDLTMFVTVFFALLNTKTGRLMYVNAGHNPPLVLQGSTIKAHLKPSGPVVGVIADMPFKIESVELEPGDTLLSFTDGVPDARSPEHEMFTDARLEALVQSQPVESADGLVELIDSTLWAHIGDAYQFDDITMMAVRREK